MSTKGKLQTKFGEVEYNACGGADYVYVGTDESITVFGVEYKASYRMKRVAGVWEPEGPGALYLSRRDSYKDGSQAARNAVREAYTAAWIEFVAANPDVLDDAAVENLEREIERLAAERQEAREKAQQLSENQWAKQEELDQLKERIRTARFTKGVA